MSDSYEIGTARTVSANVSFDGSKFERISSTDIMSKNVRYLSNGKISTVQSSKPDSDELVEQAKSIVKYGSPCDVPFVGKTEIKPLNICDETTMTSREMIDIMGEFVNDLKKIDERLVVSAQLGSSFTDISLKTSEGFESSYRKSRWSYGGAISLMRGDDLLDIYARKSAIRPNFELETLKKEFAQKLEYSKDVVDFKAGAYPVIFTPSEVGNVINPIVQSLNGQAVFRKVSPWSEKLGQELLDKRFYLYDDCTIDDFWGSKPFDQEGTPSQRTALVEGGQLKELLTNRKVAAQLKRTSSGNASPMGISPNFLHLNPGKTSLEDLIKGIDYGLMIDGTMGAWSGNPFSGIVTGTISMGLKIEGGKIVGRVKDCMFTINAFEHFNKHLVDFSAEVEETFSSRMPYVCLNEVVISAK